MNPSTSKAQIPRILNLPKVILPSTITEMRIATADEHLSLEKTKEQTYDLLDSFRLAVCFIK
jgi:hypothetical protein